MHDRDPNLRRSDIDPRSPARKAECEAQEAPRPMEAMSGMPMRERADHLLGRKIAEHQDRIAHLDTLRRYLPLEWPPELERALYHLISDLRR